MCQLFRIKGHVQGVFFRDSTREVAGTLELNGYAINLPDGSVEVRACGGHEAVEQLEDWLHKGPPLASVTNVDRIDVTCSQPVGFRIG